jgi:hypothetical protein
LVVGFGGEGEMARVVGVAFVWVISGVVRLDWAGLGSNDSSGKSDGWPKRNSGSVVHPL